jgi:hypothetical protein
LILEALGRAIELLVDLRGGIAGLLGRDASRRGWNHGTRFTHLDAREVPVVVEVNENTIYNRTSASATELTEAYQLLSSTRAP